MRIPVIQGVIDRRILVNFRVKPEFIQPLLPPPFRPKLVDGWAMAGICMIRFKQLRPKHLPAMLGMSSENAAHRIAVQWDRDGGAHDGVYIARRDSSSRFNAIAGGRLFPGIHHRAQFDVRETADDFHVEMKSIDDQVRVLVEGAISASLPADSIFASLEEASAFFEAGSVGYSPTTEADQFEGMELRSLGWKVEPLDVRRVESTFFVDSDRFPAGSTAFDCALIMRGIQHEWHDCGRMCGDASLAEGA